MRLKKYPANDFGLYDMAGNVVECARCLQTHN
jgi:formylglycine-generating enzyme required for sulfatase activity